MSPSQRCQRWSKEQWQQKSLWEAHHNTSLTPARTDLVICICFERSLTLYLCNGNTSPYCLSTVSSSCLGGDSRASWRNVRGVVKMSAPLKNVPQMDLTAVCTWQIKFGNWTCCLCTQAILELEPMGSIESRFSNWVKKRTCYQSD